MPKDEKGREIPSWFYAEDGNMEVYHAPLTEEEKAKVEAMWEAMTGGNYSPEKKKSQGKNE